MTGAAPGKSRTGAGRRTWWPQLGCDGSPETAIVRATIACCQTPIRRRHCASAELTPTRHHEERHEVRGGRLHVSRALAVLDGPIWGVSAPTAFSDAHKWPKKWLQATQPVDRRPTRASSRCSRASADLRGVSVDHDHCRHGLSAILGWARAGRGQKLRLGIGPKTDMSLRLPSSLQIRSEVH